MHTAPPQPQGPAGTLEWRRSGPDRGAAAVSRRGSQPAVQEQAQLQAISTARWTSQLCRSCKARGGASTLWLAGRRGARLNLLGTSLRAEPAHLAHPHTVRPRPAQARRKARDSRQQWATGLAPGAPRTPLFEPETVGDGRREPSGLDVVGSPSSSARAPLGWLDRPTTKVCC